MKQSTPKNSPDESAALQMAKILTITFFVYGLASIIWSIVDSISTTSHGTALVIHGFAHLVIAGPLNLIATSYIDKRAARWPENKQLDRWARLLTADLALAAWFIVTIPIALILGL